MLPGYLGRNLTVTNQILANSAFWLCILTTKNGKKVFNITHGNKTAELFLNFILPLWALCLPSILQMAITHSSIDSKRQNIHLPRDSIRFNDRVPSVMRKPIYLLISLEQSITRARAQINRRVSLENEERVELTRKKNRSKSICLPLPAFHRIQIVSNGIF